MTAPPEELGGAVVRNWGRRTGLISAFAVVFVGVDKVYIFRFRPCERVPFGSSTLYASMDLQKKSLLPTATAHGREKYFKYKINSLNITS